MSGTGGDDGNKESVKSVPLDLARTQITTVRTMDAKTTPLLMTNQSLKGMRVLTQSSQQAIATTSPTTIITTNIVPQAMFKQGLDSGRTAQITSILSSSQSGPTANITIQQRPAQITLTTAPAVPCVGTTYHVPRGPAVVANLAAPRGGANIPSIRTPMIVAAQSTAQGLKIHRTPSPAQTTTWLTGAPSSNGSIKPTTTVNATTTVLNARPTSTSKSQIVARAPQNISTIRPVQAAAAVIHSTIQAIGHQSSGGQHSSFKVGQSSSGSSTTSGTIQASLGNTVTIAQVLPTSSRTQAVVYSANQFSPGSRLTVSSNSATSNNIINRTNQLISRPIVQQQQQTQVSGAAARLTIPANVTATQVVTTRLVTTTPQATVLTSGGAARVQQQQSTVIGSATATGGRIMSTVQPNMTIARLTVTPTNNNNTNVVNINNALPQVSNANILSQTRTLNIHSLVAVGNTSSSSSSSSRTIAAVTGGHQSTNKITSTPGTIHFTPIPATIKATGSALVATTTANRTISVPTSTIVAQRQSVVSSQAIPISNVYSQQQQQQSDNQQNVPSTAATTSLYIHTPVSSVTRRTSPGPTIVSQPNNNNIATTSITLPYFYDASGNNYSVARPFTQQSTSFATLTQSNQQQQQIRPSPLNTQVHGIVTNQQMRLNHQVMVVEQQSNRNSSNQQQQFIQSQQQQPTTVDVIVGGGGGDQPQLSLKVSSSPRPSILRKRDHDGAPTLKAAKNLTPVLTTLSQSSPISPPLPPRPDSRGNGHSSGGSTTISATSSPGLVEVNEDSMPHVPAINVKDEHDSNDKVQQQQQLPAMMEVTPRKKPRKQQLTGNDIIDEHNDDMQFISESSMKKQFHHNQQQQQQYQQRHHHHHQQQHQHHNNNNNNNNNDDDTDGNQSTDEPRRDGAPEDGQVTTVRKPASASLLNSYRQTWKATHNHYVRYSDVRPKDERRPTIMDLANQYRVQEKVNGWKIYHLSTQMEDLADEEQTVYNQLNELLKCTESQETSNNFDKDVNRINELIKGNLQRIKIINDGMIEAKTQIMKIFDHKVHVTDIINRCASKRNFKKREKV